MEAPLRRRISRARRALDFANAHPLPDSGYTTVVTRLKAEIDQADSLGMLQGTGGERQHAAVVRRQAVKKTARTQLLRRLCRIAELAAEGQPDLANKFILPESAVATRAFVLKAQAMLADATASKDVLSSVGLGDTFIADLNQAVADLDSSTENAHAGRNDHVGATGGLPASWIAATATWISSTRLSRPSSRTTCRASPPGAVPRTSLVHSRHTQPRKRHR